MPQTNACQLVLKYMLMNKKTFTKAYHDRLYYFSSGSKFMEVSGRLNKWMDERNKERKTFLQDPVPNTRAPMRPELLMKRSVLYVIYEFTSTSFTPHVYVIHTTRLRHLYNTSTTIEILTCHNMHHTTGWSTTTGCSTFWGTRSYPLWRQSQPRMGLWHSNPKDTFGWWVRTNGRWLMSSLCGTCWDTSLNNSGRISRCQIWSSTLVVSDGGFKERTKSFLGVKSLTSYHRTTSFLWVTVGPCRHQKWHHSVRRHRVNVRIRCVKTQPMKSHRKFLGVPQQDRSLFFQIHMSVFFT